MERIFRSKATSGRRQRLRRLPYNRRLLLTKAANKRAPPSIRVVGFRLPRVAKELEMVETLTSLGATELDEIPKLEPDALAIVARLLPGPKKAKFMDAVEELRRRFGSGGGGGGPVPLPPPTATLEMETKIQHSEKSGEFFTTPQKSRADRGRFEALKHWLSVATRKGYGGPVVERCKRALDKEEIRDRNEKKRMEEIHRQVKQIDDEGKALRTLAQEQ